MMFIKTLLIGCCLFLLSVKAVASECYHYHTGKRVEIIHQNERTFLQISVIDPNGISIASQNCYPIPGASPELKLTDVRGNGTEAFQLAEDYENYYYLSTQYPQDTVKLLKIAEKKNVSSFFSTTLGCINGKWQQLRFNVYNDSLTTTEVKGFPDEATVVGNMGNRAFLLQDHQYLYAYDVRDARVTAYQTLDGNTLHVEELDDNNYLVVDKDQAFFLELPWFQKTDLTPDLLASDLTKPFHLNGVHYLSYAHVLDINGELFGINGGSSLYRLPDTDFYKGNKLLLERNEKLYMAPWDAYAGFQPVDASDVQALANLYLTNSGYYTDDHFYYYFDYDKKKLVKMVDFSIDYAFTRGVFSYMHGTGNFYNNETEICYINQNEHQIVERIPHSTPLKNLQIAYAFDDKLLIENKVIEHAADYHSLSFLGSTVDVISGCDGGDGQIPIVIEYNYFFRDENHIYFYRTGDKKLHTIPDDIVQYIVVKGADALSYGEMNALINII